jgi:hypothetical protein
MSYRSAVVLGVGFAVLATLASSCSESDKPLGSPADGGADAVPVVPDGGVDAANGDGGAPGRMGALVTTTMDSRVGVLLDEIPASMRERVATALLAKPNEFWIARAKAQVNMTRYRLSFRASFYPDTKKQQLPLPPESQWKITIKPNGGGAVAPERTTIGTHDLVLVNYTLSSTLLSTLDSPGTTEPPLANVGGIWDEPFTLPIDPELLVQRTGYACMDELGFPENSVDPEEAAVFYDQDCDVEPELSHDGCHLTRLSAQSCRDALDANVGQIETKVHFERIAWNEAQAAAVRVGEVTYQDGPDIASGAHSEIFPKPKVVYRYIPADSCTLVEKCVGGPGWRRLLQFSSVNWNVGVKTLEIGAIDYLVTDAGPTELANHNIYEYSACHGHFHFMHYGNFTYGEQQSAANSKRGFCLQSTDRLSNNEFTPLHNPYGDCSYQGIESGWGDNYNAGIECQWIDVTGYDVSGGPVTRKLKETFNNDAFLCEGKPVLDPSGKRVWEPTTFKTEADASVDRPKCEFFPGWDKNNTNEEDITIPGAGQSYVTQPCTRGQIGPLRNCGFKKQSDRVTCTAGAPVTLHCSVPVGAAPHTIRVCESSVALKSGIACTADEALGNKVVVPAGVDVNFTCPAARDGIEKGGAYSLYASTLVDEDTLATVTCAVP